LICRYIHQYDEYHEEYFRIQKYFDQEFERVLLIKRDHRVLIERNFRVHKYLNNEILSVFVR
jgi:hypothetical protein